MSWQIELPIIVRTLINDLDVTPTYTDDRLQQTLVVAAQYVNREMKRQRPERNKLERPI